jgi:hypothetical protein
MFGFVKRINQSTLLGASRVNSRVLLSFPSNPVSLVKLNVKELNHDRTIDIRKNIFFQRIPIDSRYNGIVFHAHHESRLVGQH